MNKILLFILIVFVINAKAQITFEHDYDSASTYASGSPALSDQLEIINFVVSGEKYVKINRHGEKIMIYNLNHSLLETIDYSGFPQSSPAYVYILYLSENLFDTDSKIEFMYLASGGIKPYTGIYRDDGSIIFSDTGAAVIFQEFPPQQYPIYNTSEGTKMILSYNNGHAKVFSLPGTLSSCCNTENIVY